MRKIAVFLVLLMSLVFCSNCVARVYGSPGSMRAGEYKYVENPDGTWSEYYQDAEGRIPIRGDTYSESEMLETDRLYTEIAVDAGTTAQDGSIVIGSTPDGIYAAERIVHGPEGLAETGPYTTAGEAEVGDEFIAAGIADGTLPALGATAAAAGGAVAASLGGAAIIGVGVAVGAGIDELLGIPAFTLLGTDQQNTNFSEVHNGIWRVHYEEEVVLGEIASCIQPEIGGGSGTKDLDPGESECEFPGVKWKGQWSYEIKGKEYEGECSTRSSESGAESVGRVSGSWWAYSPTVYCEHDLIPSRCPHGKIWFQCEAVEEGEVNATVRFSAGLIATFNYLAFPQSGLKGDENTAHAPTAPPVPALPAVSPITPPRPSEVPPPARHYTIKHAEKKQTKKEEEEKLDPVPLIPPLEEGEPIPEPKWPEMPAIKPGEVWTAYKSAVETAGFPAPREHVLPETAIDPNVGPEGVVSATPAPGTRADPKTVPDVNVNPGDAPVPTEPPGHVGGPTLPGIKYPNFEVLCHGFPFGVPCWLVSTIVGMSTTAKAPNWTIVPKIEVEGYKTPEGKFNFAKLEPIMEIVRPAMIAFTTIGIVLLFYSFAKGGGPPSGGNADSAPIPEPDDDVYL